MMRRVLFQLAVAALVLWSVGPVLWGLLASFTPPGGAKAPT